MVDDKSVWCYTIGIVIDKEKQMIAPSNYYSIYCKVTGLITAKGSKKAMLRIIKKNRGVYQLAITSRPVGSIFGA